MLFYFKKYSRPTDGNRYMYKPSRAAGKADLRVRSLTR